MLRGIPSVPLLILIAGLSHQANHSMSASPESDPAEIFRKYPDWEMVYSTDYSKQSISFGADGRFRWKYDYSDLTKSQYAQLPKKMPLVGEFQGTYRVFKEVLTMGYPPSICMELQIEPPDVKGMPPEFANGFEWQFLYFDESYPVLSDVHYSNWAPAPLVEKMSQETEEIRERNLKIQRYRERKHKQDPQDALSR